MIISNNKLIKYIPKKTVLRNNIILNDYILFIPKCEFANCGNDNDKHVIKFVVICYTFIKLLF